MELEPLKNKKITFLTQDAEVIDGFVSKDVDSAIEWFLKEYQGYWNGGNALSPKEMRCIFEEAFEDVMLK